MEVAFGGLIYRRVQKHLLGRQGYKKERSDIRY